MNKDIVISVENLSKMYRLGRVNSGSFGHDIKRWWASVRGKDDPFSMIAAENDRTQKSDNEYVWALKDVSFEVGRGDVLGIVGRNGAGKSTLLKMLTRVTLPTTGSIKAKGRIASLLEVGTGFHPDLTGRENIYLNGAILGMSKSEITKKFDEIVDFSGVDRYIDTPVKRYSSGMYVRLAFGVAAHLESEILIIDEVLAVGDTEFQKKCLGKMGDVANKEGRTVLFVSHNTAAVKQLCNKGLLMKNGTLLANGSVHEILDKYLSEGDKSSKYQAHDDSEKPIQILSATLLNAKEEETSGFSHDQEVRLRFVLKNNTSKKGLRCNIGLFDTLDQLILIDRFEIQSNSGVQTYEAVIPGDTYIPNNYKFSISIDVPSVELIELMPKFLFFELINFGNEAGKYGDSENGIIKSNLIWR